ncbi:MAG TPA: fluoride efflux transporter CrcB [Gaiellaceae bacterium]|jgi:CrcB protein|nr:fluoride efflux transporter CrcB [Gaiellaceae bacterium]
MSIAVWIGVACLGGCGALARFLLDGAIGSRLGGEFPWGTFAINVSGSFVLGLLVGAAVAGNALVLAGTATIGSYTTFSTWMLETHRLGEDDDRLLLVANVVGSLVTGVAAAYLGRQIGRTL